MIGTQPTHLHLRGSASIPPVRRKSFSQRAPLKLSLYDGTKGKVSTPSPWRVEQTKERRDDGFFHLQSSLCSLRLLASLPVAFLPFDLRHSLFDLTLVPPCLVASPPCCCSFAIRYSTFAIQRCHMMTFEKTYFAKRSHLEHSLTKHNANFTTDHGHEASRRNWQSGQARRAPTENVNIADGHGNAKMGVFQARNPRKT